MISTYRYQATKVRKWFHPEDTSSSFLVIWKIFFPPWNSDECEDLLFNVRIILGLSPCDRQNSHGDTLHSLRILIFNVFQGPSFSLFLFNSWVVQNHTENCYRRLQRWLAPLCSGNWLFPVFILVQSVPQLPFSKMSCIPPK